MEGKDARLGFYHIITIDNLSDDKFYDFSVINPEWKSIQHKVKYSYYNSKGGTSYDDFIQSLSKSKQKVGLIYNRSNSGYDKFMRKQIEQPMTFKEILENGQPTDWFMESKMDIYQFQSNITVIKIELHPDKKKPILTKGSDLVLTHLMPETTHAVTFYITEYQEIKPD